MKRKFTYGVGNPDYDLGQAHKYGRVKPVNNLTVYYI